MLDLVSVSMVQLVLDIAALSTCWLTWDMGGEFKTHTTRRGRGVQGLGLDAESGDKWEQEECEDDVKCGETKWKGVQKGKRSGKATRKRSAMTQT